MKYYDGSPWLFRTPVALTEPWKNRRPHVEYFISFLAKVISFFFFQSEYLIGGGRVLFYFFKEEKESDDHVRGWRKIGENERGKKRGREGNDWNYVLDVDQSTPRTSYSMRSMFSRSARRRDSSYRISADLILEYLIYVYHLMSNWLDIRSIHYYEPRRFIFHEFITQQENRVRRRRRRRWPRSFLNEINQLQNLYI